MSNIVAKFADRYAVDANKVMQTLAALADNGIKPMTWYTLGEDGQFMEVAE